MGKIENVEFITGSILPLSLSDKKAGKEDFAAKIADVFKLQLSSIESGISAVNSNDHKRASVEEVAIDPNDIMLPKYARGEQNIKEDWQNVSRASYVTKDNYHDVRAVLPSRSAGETDFGGPGHNRKLSNSIFDPTAIEDARNDEYTDVVINDARERRAKSEARNQRNRDWEVISAAKSTKNVNPTQMGFTPTRSAYQPAPIQEIKIAEVEEIKLKNAASLEAGKKAAQIKTDIDKVFAKKWEQDFNDDRPWEEKAHEQIIEAQNREMNITFNEPEIADDFLKGSPVESKLDLSGIFKMPENPEDYKEAEIKRDSDYLRDPNRARREDDRSWETVSNARSRKWQG